MPTKRFSFKFFNSGLTTYFLKNLAEENSEGSIIPGRFRDFLGIGRNLSIEILECFDKIGYTQRFKSGRIIKKTSEEIIKGYSYS